MRRGASISGGLHTVFLVLAIWGVDWFSAREAEPLRVTEIEFVDGAEFDAALSSAPVVRSEGPSELTAPAASETPPDQIARPEDTTAATTAPLLADARPADERPEAPEIALPAPPTPVPTEEPVPTIAEIPSPDPLDRQSTEPESPFSTEPVQPLASAPPQPFARPSAPPEPEPEPKQVTEATEVREPDAAAETEPVAEPEPERAPDPAAVAEAQAPAPEGLAPQEARLPAARPADIAAAARAARETEPTPAPQPEPQEPRQATNEPPATPPRPDAATEPGTPAAVTARQLSRGERDALRLGIKKFYTYNGDRSDPTMAVVVRVELDQAGKITGKPVMHAARGGSDASRRALFNAGRRALLRAEAAGEFQRLPADKYPRWKLLNFVFTIDRIEFSS